MFSLLSMNKKVRSKRSNINQVSNFSLTCNGKNAPAESISITIGNPHLMALSAVSSCFLIAIGKYAPPFTVPSLAEIKQYRPWILPIPAHHIYTEVSS